MYIVSFRLIYVCYCIYVCAPSCMKCIYMYAAVYSITGGWHSVTFSLSKVLVYMPKYSKQPSFGSLQCYCRNSECGTV